MFDGITWTIDNEPLNPLASQMIEQHFEMYVAGGAKDVKFMVPYNKKWKRITIANGEVKTDRLKKIERRDLKLSLQCMMIYCFFVFWNIFRFF